MKKRVALLLCGILVISTMAGCGNNQEGSASSDSQAQQSESKEESGDEGQEDSASDGESGPGTYDETIPFTYTSIFSVNMMGSGIDYEQDSLYQYVVERFNIEPELWACEGDEAGQKIQTWINTGSMPDTLFDINFGNISSYRQYVEEGLLQALPDGWEAKWPNIAHIVEVSGMKELLVIDGKLYAIPHSIQGLYTKAAGNYMGCSAIYRKDFAKQVGMEDFGSDTIVTLSEYKEYLEKVRDAGLAPVVLDGGDFWLIRFFANIFGTSPNVIVEDEDGFLFIPETEEFRSMLKTMQEWYKAGLIDPEYYNKSDADTINNFAAGQAASMPFGGIANDVGYAASLYDASSGKSSDEDLGYLFVTADDGSMAVTETYNYWTASLFSPNTDEKTMERMLDLTDWICSLEGNTSIFCGVPGVDWDYDEAGNVSMKDGKKTRTPDDFPFYFLGWCPDEFVMTGNVEVSKTCIDFGKAAIDYMVNKCKKYEISYNYENYTSELKDNFSFPLNSKIKEIICTDVDVDSAWDAHLDEYRSLWEPFIEDLNKTYGYTD